MKAMILAAGLGTRLRPLTDDRPKALVEIDGRTLLEIALSRLSGFGIREVIVNVHHFADMVVEYLNAHESFGMHIEVSREDLLLDTGGGLKKAAHFFADAMNPTGAAEAFLVHNVDVLSNIDLPRMVRSHSESQALATLAVQDRQTSRHLLFDDQMQLCGRQTGNHPPELARDCQKTQPLAFAGIHVISPRLLSMLSEEGQFSIITSYLRLAQNQQEKIMAFRADDSYWLDLGTPENIAQAARALKNKTLNN